MHLHSEVRPQPPVIITRAHWSRAHGKSQQEAVSCQVLTFSGSKAERRRRSEQHATSHSRGGMLLKAGFDLHGHRRRHARRREQYGGTIRGGICSRIVLADKAGLRS